MLKRLKLSVVRRTFSAYCVLLCCALHAEEPTLKSYPVESIKSDFAQLYEGLKQAHYNLFANLPEDQYEAQYHRYLAQITMPLTEDEIRVLFQRFVALGKVAHANIELPMKSFLHYREHGGSMLPLFIRIDKSKVYVEQFYGENKDIAPGTEIIELNGQPIFSWINQLSGLVSADTEVLAATLIESRFPFLVWLLLGEQAQFTITTTTQGQSVTHTVKALSREEQNQYSASKAEAPTAERDWRILEHNIGWLKPGPFYNIDPDAENIWDNNAFTQFVDAAMQQMSAANVKALILDVRNNPGGSNSFSDHLISWFANKPFKFASDFKVKISEQAVAANAKRLAETNNKDTISIQLADFYAQYKTGEIQSFSLPEHHPLQTHKFNKPVYLIINRYSYSNAVSVAAILKDYGLAKIIGEATADLATTYGAMEHFTLPHTGIKVGFPKALIIRPNGEPKPSGVTPDIVIPMEITWTEEQQLDTVLKAVVADLQR